MSIRLKFVDGKIRGIIPAGLQKPDYETIFPDIEIPEELLDKYGNGQYEIQVTVKEVDGQTVTECKPILKPKRPTDEQITKYKNRRYAEEVHTRYSQDDEIAITKKITEKLLNGETPLPEDVQAFKDMQDFVRGRKDRVRQEIEEDLKTI